MKRRTLLACATALVGSLTLSVTAAQADELKFASFAGTKYPLHGEMFVPFTEQVKEATGGKLTVRIYPGGELGKGPAKQFDRVTSGVADIAFGLPGYTASKFPLTLLTELPGVSDNPVDDIYSNLDLLKKEYRRVKVLTVFDNPQAVLLSREKPIKSIDDLKGMKIRVPSRNIGRVAEAWGATPVSMPITQVYNSMQTGVIDGVLVDTSVLTSFKLAEVTKYVTMGMESTKSPMFVVMNRDVWKDLSSKEQAAIDANSGLAMSQLGQKVKIADSAKAEKFFTDSGKEIITLSAEEAARFNAASAKVVAEVVAELEGKGVPAKAFVAALKD